MLQRLLKRILLPPMVIIAAVIMFVEEWLWDHLAALMRRLSRTAPVRALEAWLAGLPPYAAVAAFLLPGTLLLPVKLAALYLIAHHHAVAGLTVIIAAKLIGTACAARLYAVCRPALLTLRWFRWLHDTIIRFKTWLYSAIKAMPGWETAVRWKNKIKSWLPRGGALRRRWHAIVWLLRNRVFRRK